MMEFPYLFRYEQPYPIVPISLSKEDKILRTEALVDSGANVSVFSADIAEYLGIDILKGEKIYLQGVGGRIVGYLHNVELEIEEIKFLCKIAFSMELVISFNLLGRDNFFYQFVISFDESQNILTLMSKNVQL